MIWGELWGKRFVGFNSWGGVWGYLIDVFLFILFFFLSF